MTYSKTALRAAAPALFALAAISTSSAFRAIAEQCFCRHASGQRSRPRRSVAGHQPYDPSQAAERSGIREDRRRTLRSRLAYLSSLAHRRRSEEVRTAAGTASRCTERVGKSWACHHFFGREWLFIRACDTTANANAPSIPRLQYVDPSVSAQWQALSR